METLREEVWPGMADDPTGVTLFLCGDVMLGRGIDQLFAQACEPSLKEGYIRDARDYIRLVERYEGPIQRPVEPSYVWGETLSELQRVGPAARLLNLETSVTVCPEFWPAKGINYRMHPANLGVLTVAGVDACALANNHVLDFGRRGLEETLKSLTAVGIRTAGAGRTLEEASAPARIRFSRGGGLLLFSVGTDESGIPPDWGAAEGTAGVDLLPDLSADTADSLLERVERQRGEDELALVSIHWGDNWGYEVPEEQVVFAHRLIDRGVDLVHGHSSHHPRPLEVYRGKLVLYGCGDFINDYEGISGHEEYRSELRVMYFPELDPRDRTLRALRMVVLRSKKLRLERASSEEVAWLGQTLTEASRSFGTRVVPGPDSVLELR